MAVGDMRESGAHTLDAQALKEYYEKLPRVGGIVSKCEMWLPQDMAGLTVLDLQCRRGKGVYQIAEKVGAAGLAIGVDSSPQFIEDAIEHAPENSHTGRYEDSNMRFYCGYMEALDKVGIRDESIDVVIANSGFWLACDVRRALCEVRRVLKPQGRFYHAMLVASKSIPQEVAIDLRCNHGSAFGCAPTVEEAASLVREAGLAICDLSEPEAVELDAEVASRMALGAGGGLRDIDFCMVVLDARVQLQS